MKRFKILIAIIATILLFNSCEKDENGYRITYYKNKTAIGWLFYKFENDSIAPITNFKMKSYCSGENRGWIFPWSREHIDYVYTDNNGKFTCKLVKKINNDKGSYYEIGYGQSFPIEPDYIEGSGKSSSFFLRDIENIEIMNLDTAFCYVILMK